MSLQMGDVLADEISEWRVIGRPFSTAAIGSEPWSAAWQRSRSLR